MSDPVEKKFWTQHELAVHLKSRLLRDHPKIDVNWADHNQWTPLHVASFLVAKLLLAHPDINVNLKNESGQTPFYLVGNGHVSVVRVLLKDPRVDVTLDNKGRTPLWWGSIYARYEVVEWFIASGRDLGDIENKKGKWWGKYYSP